MRGEEEYDLRQTRGGEYSGSALRGHWNNTRTAYNTDDCNGKNHTYYRGDGGYGNNNSDGYYTGARPDNYGNDSCGYDVHEANDGYGNHNSEGGYAYANIDDYNDGSCGYTGQYGGYGDYYGGNYCKSEYGGDYNGGVGAETDTYETNDPPPAEEKLMNMATRLKRRQMRIAKLEEGLENIEKGVIKLVRSLEKLNKFHQKQPRQ